MGECSEEFDAWVGIPLPRRRLLKRAALAAACSELAQRTPVPKLGGNGRVKPTMAVRTKRVVAVPNHAQGCGTERTSGRPLRTAFRTLLKQRHVPAEGLANFLQVEDETARGVAANEEMFHGLSLL